MQEADNYLGEATVEAELSEWSIERYVRIGVKERRCMPWPEKVCSYSSTNVVGLLTP